jgi:benzoate membrane transport protein
VKPLPPIGFTSIELTAPAWDLATLIGLGVPLYLVTMASQNLPGFRRAARVGLSAPDPTDSGRHGRGVARHGLHGAHTSNLAAISAALCTGPDAHPDPAKRWMTGPFYALFWGLIAVFGASLVGLFGALPPALLATVAGTALLGSMAGAMGSALAGDQDRLAAAGTLASLCRASL